MHERSEPEAAPSRMSITAWIVGALAVFGLMMTAAITLNWFGSPTPASAAPAPVAPAPVQPAAVPGPLPAPPPTPAPPPPVVKAPAKKATTAVQRKRIVRKPIRKQVCTCTVQKKTVKPVKYIAKKNSEHVVHKASKKAAKKICSKR
ncbi:hypothetical protein EV193_101632 [Herbihabitans rhizosphaerae]|uniref:Uncharacterized protein n=1 Tax=Herbihabitans rhizosphaerae TaxID=1872711 RepID=A0A4Q7L633_9PSEU|nr:hypothetical protein [Herbihabitans rhizosphaerae]RZS44754.1 hypothetical protein EV193_101632 [Herbihabitans rhizosphaerae]